MEFDGNGYLVETALLAELDWQRRGLVSSVSLPLYNNIQMRQRMERHSETKRREGKRGIETKEKEAKRMEEGRKGTEDIANQELGELLARLVRVLDALEVRRSILAQKLYKRKDKKNEKITIKYRDRGEKGDEDLHEDDLTTGVIRDPRSDVIDLLLDDQPAVSDAIVLRHLSAEHDEKGEPKRQIRKEGKVRRKKR